MSDKLAGVHPRLITKAHLIQQAMTALGFPMIVTDGVRTVEQQQALYAQGRNPQGMVIDRSKIVTNDDGVTHKSNHQLHADGLGHAVDMAFLDADGRPTWAESMPWACYGACAKALGLVWGGDWGTLVDRPHIELRDGT